MELFKKATRSLYDKVNENFDAGNLNDAPPTELNFLLVKEDFEPEIWSFLVEQQDNFYFPAITNNEPREYRAYEVRGNSLYSNRKNLIGLPHNYKSSK